jgi:oligopeptide transport system substrate-binding protein
MFGKRFARVFMGLMTVVLILSFVAACAPGAEKPGAELRLNLGTEPPFVDPALATDSASINVNQNLFVGLTHFEPGTLKVLPFLAESWEVSADGMVYTFKLRNDAKWTDGKPVTAGDVEYGIKRTLNPETASEYAYVLYIIEGAEAYNTGEGSADGVAVKAVDDYTLEIKLTDAAGYFPAIAGMWVARPVPQWAIEEHGDKWTEAENMVSNGPYKLETWEHENKIVLVKNPDWWGAKDVTIDKVTWFMVQEDSTGVAMYENDELDFYGAQIGSIPPADMDRMKADPELSKQLNIVADLATYYYGFNVTKPPFDNVLVRKAFAGSIDRQKLIDDVTKANQEPATTFACRGIFGFVPPEENIGIQYDPEQARKWLEEAGYPGGEGLPEITLMFNFTEGHQAIAQFVQAQWKENLGVEVKLANQEWKVYLDTLTEDPPQVWRLGWGADYPDANNFLNEVFHSESPNNNTRWKNEEFDNLVKGAAVEQDPDKRLEMYKRADQILCEEDVAMIPLYWYAQSLLAKPWLEYNYIPTGGQELWTWKIAEH